MSEGQSWIGQASFSAHPAQSFGARFSTWYRENPYAFPVPEPTVHCQPSRLAAREPSSRWVKNASSPSRQRAPARTVHWLASHMRVWFTSHPSSCSSDTVVSMQAMSRGQGSSQSSGGRGGWARRSSPSRVPTRAYTCRAYSCQASSSRYFVRSRDGASATCSHRAGSESSP